MLILYFILCRKYTARLESFCSILKRKTSRLYILNKLFLMKISICLRDLENSQLVLSPSIIKVQTGGAFKSALLIDPEIYMQTQYFNSKLVWHGNFLFPKLFIKLMLALPVEKVWVLIKPLVLFFLTSRNSLSSYISCPAFYFNNKILFCSYLPYCLLVDNLGLKKVLPKI